MSTNPKPANPVADGIDKNYKTLAKIYDRSKPAKREK